MSRREVALLANPSAGAGRAAGLIETVRKTLAQALPDARVTLLPAGDFEQSRQAAQAMVERARPGDELVLMGGDGMLGMGVGVAAGTSVPVGLIPAGTGNDLCRGLGIPRDPLAAARVIADSPIRSVDLIEVTGKLAGGPAAGTEQTRFIGSIVATGFDARVNRRANRIQLPLGPLRYVVGIAAELATFSPITYRLRIDGRVREVPAMLVAVANTPYFGGGVTIAPDADPEDGLLDVTVIHPVGRTVLVQLMPGLYTGRFTHHPAVEQFRVESLELDGDQIVAMGDGEELGPTPLRLRAAAGALRVHLPERRPS